MGSDTIPARSPTVVYRDMDEGGVLFCSRTEVYFGLNPVGAEIWDRLPEHGRARGSVDDLLDSLQEAYPEVERGALAADVREFLEALEESELVVYAESEEA